MRLGVRRIPFNDYLADPCPVPSLNSSVAEVLVERTPHHAWLAHCRLNPDYQEPTAKDEQDFGSAVHALVLRSDEERVFTVEADNWKKPVFQNIRNEARGERKVVLLRRQWEEAYDLAATIRRQILDSEVGEVFRRGISERTLIWIEDGCYLRIRLDRWTRAYGMALDLKTTNGSAGPDDWPHSAQGLWRGGAALQHAFYRRGLEAVTGLKHRLVFMVAEVDTGLVSLVEPDLEAQENADRDVEDAIRLWRACLTTGEWPGYGPRIHAVSAPAGHTMRRETARLIRPHPSREAIEAARRMQAPPTPGKSKRSRRS